MRIEASFRDSPYCLILQRDFGGNFIGGMAGHLTSPFRKMDKVWLGTSYCVCLTINRPELNNLPRYATHDLHPELLTYLAVLSADLSLVSFMVSKGGTV